jgi:NTE family protein
LDALESWVLGLSRRDILKYLDFKILGGGLISGEEQKTLLADRFGDPQIESLNRPFIAVATNLRSGLEVWFRDGSLLDAIEASVALPGLFAPVHSNGRWLVDGGLVNPVPVAACRALGAEKIIAVNLNSDIVGKHLPPTRKTKPSEADIKSTDAKQQRWYEQLTANVLRDADAYISRLWSNQMENPGVLDVLLSSINIMQDRITRSRLAGEPPELLLEPRLSRLALMAFDEGEAAIKEGKECVERMLPVLDALMDDI